MVDIAVVAVVSVSPIVPHTNAPSISGNYRQLSWPPPEMRPIQYDAGNLIELLEISVQLTHTHTRTHSKQSIRTSAERATSDYPTVYNVGFRTGRNGRGALVSAVLLIHAFMRA